MRARSGPNPGLTHANPEFSDQQHGVLMMTYGKHVSPASSQPGQRSIGRPEKAASRWSRWRLDARQTSAKPALGLAVVAAMILALGAPAIARSPYDGLWSVVIMAETGTCDRAYRYPVQIANGRLMQDPGSADPSIRVAGRVDKRGTVTVKVIRGDQWAQGSGRLSPPRGFGTWNSPTAQCSGKWTAERRV
jgi:hypothetical protein